MSRELLTAAQQSRITALVTDYLPTDVTVSVLRKTDVPDGAGGQTSTWAPRYTGIAALITPFISRVGGVEAVLQNIFFQDALWKISLPAGTDVTALDRIESSTGRTWEVKTVWGVESLEVIRECSCVEVLSG